MATQTSPGANRSRPLSVVEVLRATLRVYRRGFVAFVIVMGLSAVTEALVSAAYDLIAGFADSATEEGQPLRARAPWMLVRLLSLLANGGYSVVGEALFGGIAIVLASNMILGQPVDLAGACRQAARRLGSLVLAVGLTWLVVLLLFVTVLGIPFAIYIGLGWMLASQIVLLEGFGWRDAMRRSSDMVRWHRWWLLACYLIVSLVETILYAIPACALAYGSGGTIWGPVCAIPEGASTLVWLADIGLQGLSTALFHALTVITMTLLYYDFRACDERLDLDLRAAVSDRQPAA